MFSIRRSCQSALLTSKSITPLANASRRAFSRSSVCRRGALPVFLEASSPELSTLLQTLNQRVLLPSHLTKAQAKLVYKQENKAKLEAEPIEITLGDVTLPLEPLDRNRDIPSRWKTIKEVVAQSKTPEDWENVVRIMEGFENAGQPLKAQWKELIVRKLGDAGQHHLILKAAQRAAATGLRLDNPQMVRTVFRVLHWKALESKWDEEETRKALALAEQFVELMEGDEHLGKKNVVPGDLRASPFTIAMPLELAAVRAKRHTDGQDKDGKVAKYASRFMKATNQDDFLTVTLPAELQYITSPVELKPKVFETAQSIIVHKGRTQGIIPLWIAVKTARQVLGADMPMASEAQQLEQDLTTAVQTGERMLKEAIETNMKGRLSSDMIGRLPADIQLAKEA